MLCTSSVMCTSVLGGIGAIRLYTECPDWSGGLHPSRFKYFVKTSLGSSVFHTGRAIFWKHSHAMLKKKSTRVPLPFVLPFHPQNNFSPNLLTSISKSKRCVRSLSVQLDFFQIRLTNLTLVSSSRFCSFSFFANYIAAGLSTITV
jgi:hypothetical protein